MSAPARDLGWALHSPEADRLLDEVCHGFAADQVLTICIRVVEGVSVVAVHTTLSGPEPVAMLCLRTIEAMTEERFEDVEYEILTTFV